MIGDMFPTLAQVLEHRELFVSYLALGDEEIHYGVWLVLLEAQSHRLAPHTAAIAELVEHLAPHERQVLLERNTAIATLMQAVPAGAH